MNNGSIYNCSVAVDVSAGIRCFGDRGTWLVTIMFNIWF